MPVTTTITVAAGVFAPGHLGELTRVMPFELADAVLEEEGGREQRVRLVPSRAGLLPGGMGQADRGAAGAGAGDAFGEGAAEPAPPSRYPAGEAAVRDPGRA